MSSSTTVTVADILELRGDGLSEEEVWSLLCQSVQTLQDIFLTDEIHRRSNVLPIVTPHNLEIGRKGRITISYVSDATDSEKQFLCPEYSSGNRERFPDFFGSEKMWVYSLGKALQSSLKTKADVGTTNLDLVLAFMTKENPYHRASLMALLNVISEHWSLHLQSKPFSYHVMDMYREVFGTPIQCLLPRSSLKRPRKRLEENGSSPSESKISPITPSDLIVLSENRMPETKRNPVQRAPSRLYRGPTKHDASTRGTATLSCVGPEFVVRVTETPKIVEIGDSKMSSRLSVTVVLLTGVRIKIVCDPHAVTVGKLFEIVVQTEQLEDNYIFGLACMMNGDFAFLPSDIKLHKLGPTWWKGSKIGKKYWSATRILLLFLRVKFFLPNLRGVRSFVTKHLFYLQLRRSLIEQQIKCDRKELLGLGGLALQAEFGDYVEQEHGSSAYFLLEHYLPEELIEDRIELEGRLQELHRSRRGLEPERAEEIFIAQTQRLPEYGSHHCAAQWMRKSAKIPMWVTVNPQGVYLCEKKNKIFDRKIHEAFTWKNIQGLKFDEHNFYIVPHDVGRQKLTTYKLKMDNKKSFYFFRLASFHHQFFLKLRVELSSLQSLSLEFGVALTKKETEEKENKKNLIRERIWRSEKYQKRMLTSFYSSSSSSNTDKENEGPSEKRREKRKGVKMGVRAFHAAANAANGGQRGLWPPGGLGRRSSLSTKTSNSSSDAYVLDSSIRSIRPVEGAFRYDPEETLSSALVDKLSNISWENERVLRRVRLSKDRHGSFGLEVVEGDNGGVFVENVLKARAEEEEEVIEAVRKGDQVIAVNGICLLNLEYGNALNVLKSAGHEIEVLVSQRYQRQEAMMHEHEYLKNIRYDTALEADNCESKIIVTNVPTLDRTRNFRPFTAQPSFVFSPTQVITAKSTGKRIAQECRTIENQMEKKEDCPEKKKGSTHITTEEAERGNCRDPEV